MTFSPVKNVEDITCLHVDINFIFEFSTLYLTSEHWHEKIKFMSTSRHVIFCLLPGKHQWNTKWAFVQKLHIFTRENNILSWHVKRLPLLWLHNKLHLFHWCLCNKPGGVQPMTVRHAGRNYSMSVGWIWVSYNQSHIQQARMKNCFIKNAPKI